MIQLKNRVISLEAVNYASISFPDENTDNDWIELVLIVNGHPVVLSGDDALVLWQHLTKNITLLAPSPGILEDKIDGYALDYEITAPYGQPTA